MRIAFVRQAGCLCGTRRRSRCVDRRHLLGRIQLQTVCFVPTRARPPRRVSASADDRAAVRGRLNLSLHDLNDRFRTAPTGDAPSEIAGRVREGCVDLAIPTRSGRLMPVCGAAMKNLPCRSRAEHLDATTSAINCPRHPFVRPSSQHETMTDRGREIRTSYRRFGLQSDQPGAERSRHGLAARGDTEFVEDRRDVIPRREGGDAQLLADRAVR